MIRRSLILMIPLLVLMWILNVCRTGSWIEGCLSGCAVMREVENGIIRVISLNMLHGFPKFEYLDQRIEIIAAEINRLNPDIVLLQEVPWTIKRGSAARILAELTGMNYAYLRANGNRWMIAFEEGEAILSQYPLVEPDFTELQPRSGFFEKRIVLNLIAITEMGEIGLYVTHLTHDDPVINRKQSESLMTFVETKNTVFTVVAGDFNAQPDSPQIKALTSIWIDPFMQNTDKGIPYTCCIDSLTQEQAFPNERIDYVFLIPGTKTPQVFATGRLFYQPFEIDDGWIWASDHIGLMVDINGSHTGTQ